jgi:hypothetical protein
MAGTSSVAVTRWTPCRANPPKARGRFNLALIDEVRIMYIMVNNGFIIEADPYLSHLAWKPFLDVTD